MCKLTEVFWESVPKSWCSVGKGKVAELQRVCLFPCFQYMYIARNCQTIRVGQYLYIALVFTFNFKRCFIQAYNSNSGDFLLAYVSARVFSINGLNTYMC